MKCPNCGRKIKVKGVSYCPYCGGSLGNLNQDLREVTKIQIEYQEAKEKASEWGIGVGVGFAGGVACLLLAPFTFFITFFIAVPLFILGIVSAVLAAHYQGHAKKLKDEL